MKKLIYLIIILDFIFLAIFYLTYFHSLPYKGNKKQETKTVKSYYDDTISLPFYYGDKIKNHVLKSINSKNINITNKNRNFKFITILEIDSIINLNPYNLNFFIETRKILTDKKLEFIVLFFGKLNKKNIPMLNELSKMYNFSVAEIDSFDLKTYYNLTQSKNGFRVLLDSDNRVRMFTNEVASQIENVIQKELKKEGNITK